MTVRAAFAAAADLLSAHHSAPEGSRLRRLCPHVGPTFLDLDLMSALAEYDAGMHITARKYVAPSFREVRHVLNLAVVRAAAPALALVTFDADETLYTDGE